MKEAVVKSELVFVDPPPPLRAYEAVKAYDEEIDELLAIA